MFKEAFSVYAVPDDAPAKTETMGTKPKFWFSRGGPMWLFKATRPGQGEHWAEVISAGLAEKLGLPHAHYELARWHGTPGVVTPRFTPDGFDLVHGNELLAERDPSYPREGARYVRTREHTIDAVRAELQACAGREGLEVAGVLTVEPDGRVTAVELTRGPARARACVERIVTDLVFGPHPRPMLLSFRMGGGVTLETSFQEADAPSGVEPSPRERARECRRRLDFECVVDALEGLDDLNANDRDMLTRAYGELGRGDDLRRALLAGEADTRNCVFHCRDIIRLWREDRSALERLRARRE